VRQRFNLRRIGVDTFLAKIRLLISVGAGRITRLFRRIDFVTLMLAILAAVILLFLTAELWLPHLSQLLAR